jgi:hypothetical protein
MHSSVNRRQSGNPISLVRMLAAAVVTTSLCGCIGVPLPSSYTAAPDISPLLSDEMRLSAREVIVLAQSRLRSKGGQLVINTPAFAKPEALDVLMREVKLETTEHALLTFLPLWMIPGLGTNVASAIESSLERLCMVTAEGWQFNFSIEDKRWKLTHRMPLEVMRRDAIVSALRAGGDSPFDKIDGPCGMTGKTEWPAESRARALEFLSQLPQLEPAESNPRLTALVKRARPDKAGADGGGAMLVAVGRWRNEASATPPLFLDATGYGDIKEFAGEIKGSDIDVLVGLYSPATRAKGNFAARSIIVIGSNGDLWAWNEDAHALKRVEPALSLQDCQKAMLGGLRGDYVATWTPFWGSAVCSLGKPDGWSHAQIREAIAFLQELPIQGR